MKSIATTLLFLLLAATSASTLADGPKTGPHEVRTELSADRNATEPTTASTPEARTSTPTESRKLKRCRQYFKTVGIGCRKPASR
jgi:hypothetical protein